MSSSRGGSGGGGRIGPASESDAFWPRPGDSREVLEKKYDLNRAAAMGEIVQDVFLPGRPDSSVADFQSNAMVAGEYLRDKK